MIKPHNFTNVPHLTLSFNIWVWSQSYICSYGSVLKTQLSCFKMLMTIEPDFFQNEIIVESLANVKIYSGRLLWKSCLILTSVGWGSSFHRRNPFSTFLMRGVSFISCGGVTSCSLYQLSGFCGYWGCSFFWYLLSELSTILSESGKWTCSAPISKSLRNFISWSMLSLHSIYPLIDWNSVKISMQAFYIECSYRYVVKYIYSIYYTNIHLET